MCRRSPMAQRFRKKQEDSSHHPRTTFQKLDGAAKPPKASNDF
jgi:hypothetical protein